MKLLMLEYDDLARDEITAFQDASLDMDDVDFIALAPPELFEKVNKTRFNGYDDDGRPDRTNYTAYRPIVESELLFRVFHTRYGEPEWQIVKYRGERYAAATANH